jgi:predicted nucleic acid-binding protein
MHVQGVTSYPLLNEYQDVLARPEHGLSSNDIQATLSVAKGSECSEFHEIGDPPFKRVSADPGDDHVVALVEKAQPDFLCTKDKPGLLLLEFIGDSIAITPEHLANVVVYDETVKAAVEADAAREGRALAG